MQPIGIYGMGLAGGVGLGVAAGLEAVAAGRPGLSTRPTAAGEVQGVFAPELPPPSLAGGRRLSPWLRLSLAAAQEAAAGRLSGILPERLGVVGATGFGSLTHTAAFLENMFARQEAEPQPANFIYSVHNAASTTVALALKAQGYNLTITHYATSFEQALLLAAGRLQQGWEDRLLVFGADEWHPLAHQALGRFSAWHARPGRRRDFPGEGAAALLLGPAQPDGLRILEMAVAGGESRTPGGRHEEVQNLHQAMARLGLDVGAVHRFWLGCPEEEWPGLVETFQELSGPRRDGCLRFADLTGNYFTAAAAAAVLACAELQALSGPAAAVIYNQDLHGNCAWMVMAR